MSMRLTSTLLLLASLGLASAGRQQQRAFLPQSSLVLKQGHDGSSSPLGKSKSVVLELRGGAGPLDLTTTAKAATWISLASGVLFRLCPEATLKAFQINQEDVLNKLVGHDVGSAYLAFGVVAYSLLFQGASVEAALGSGQLVWLIMILVSLINDDAGKAGFSRTAMYMWAPVSAAIVYGSRTGADWFAPLMKLCMGINALSSLLMAFKPQKGMEGYGYTKELAKDQTLLVKSQGYLFLQYSVMVFCLLAGVDTAKSIGYAWICQLAYNLSGFFITKEVQDMGLDLRMWTSWLVTHLVIVATLAIDA